MLRNKPDDFAQPTLPRIAVNDYDALRDYLKKHHRRRAVGRGAPANPPRRAVVSS
jgi:hypothetical protein